MKIASLALSVELFAFLAVPAWADSFSYAPPPLTKQASVPATGPGEGLCRDTILPSDLLVSAGVTGTPGTCSIIRQCGTSASYVIQQFNVGGGC